MKNALIIIIIFCLFYHSKGVAQNQPEENNLYKLLDDFYGKIVVRDDDKAFLLSKSIDSLLSKNESLDTKPLAIYNNAKGFIYYARNLNPEPYLIKADSLNNLLAEPSIDIKVYSSSVLANFYYDNKEDLKAKNYYSKIIEINDIPEKFYGYKTEALDRTFFIERIELKNYSDSTNAKNIAKKLINFRRKTKDTLVYSYAVANEYFNKNKDAENICLAIKNISNPNQLHNKYSKFLALNWLTNYYYRNLGNYGSISEINAYQLIKVAEELLLIIENTDYMQPERVYSVYGNIIVAAIIINDQNKIDLYETKILNLLNSSDYLNTSGFNLKNFYYTLHKLKMYFEIGENYKKAKFYAFKNAELTKYLYGEKSIEYEQELSSYESILKLKMFDYEEAYKISNVREQIVKTTFGEESEEYLEILYEQYSIRLNQLKYKEGLKLLEKAVSLLDKIDCVDSKICEDIKFSYLDCLNSNEMFEESLEQMRKFKYNENYESLFRLSATRISSYYGLKQYININFEYDWLLERITGQEEALIEDKDYSEYFFQFLLSYQEHLRSTGRLNKAISITEKYLYLFNETESSLKRIDFMIGYLGILFQINECNKALEFIDNNIILKFSNIDTPNAIALKEFNYNTTLGNIYNCLEKYPEAISYYEKANEYNGLDTSYLYSTIINLYNLSGNEKQAKKYLNIYEKLITNVESLDINELYLIADLYIRNNEREKLLKYLLPLSDMVIDHICNKSFFSANDNITDKLTHDDVLRFILSHNYGDLYDSSLGGNAVIISNLYKTRLDYFAKINLEIQKLKILENPDAIKLAKLENEFNKDPSSKLEEEIGQIKTKLISSRSIEVEGLCDVSFQDIYESIDENEMVINLMVYKYNLDKKDDYAVNFNIKESSIISPIIDLDDHYNLQKKNEIDSEFFDYIINDIFKNKKVNGDLIDTFYIIPSGKSNLINFSAFSLSLEEKLDRKIKVHIINSLTDISKIKTGRQQKIENLILIGDIDYNTGYSNPIHNNNNNNVLTRGIQLTKSIENSGIPTWGYLPGTKQEIENIDLLGKENNINTSILRGKEVTELNLKKIIIDPSKSNVIHVATHGYFFPDDDNEKTESLYSTHKNPLLRSGLILSGANENWTNKSLIDSNNDGILTAEEISFMNLSGIELIVLSACDTGLGEVSNLEGINGLQRAFKLAGANKLIMSLWKVPDKETAEFFDYFYKYLLTKKLSINEAFRKTQKVMSEKYKPYYWASFVLLE